MADLRERFGNLGWQPMPDLWTQTVRRADELGAADSSLVDAGPVVVRPVERRAGRPSPWWWTRNATLRAVIIVALLATLIVGSFAVGAWWMDRQMVVQPSVDPVIAATLQPRTGPVPPCDAMRSMADVVETHLETNTAPSWTTQAPGAQPPSRGQAIATIRIDALPNVSIVLVDPMTGDACRAVNLANATLLPWEVRWSPDGGSIAVLNQLWAASGEAHLLVWSAAGDRTTLSRPWIGTELPGIAWSPDGERIAVVAERVIRLVAGDGSPDEVVPCEPCRGQSEAVWSRDGLPLAVRTKLPGGTLGESAIFVLEESGGQLRQLDIGRERVDIAGWLESEPWHDSPHLLVFDHALGRLLEVPIDNPADYAVRNVRLVEGANLVVSPDLQRAVYVANQQRRDEELVVVDLATGATIWSIATATLDRGLPVGDIAWAPDGQTLAFTTVAPGPDWPLATGMWAVEVDGTALRPVISGPFDLADGRYLGSGPDIGGWQPAPPG